MKFKMREVLYISVFFLAVTTFAYAYINKVLPSSVTSECTLLGYDLDNPTLEIKLPKILQEISGLTDIDDQTVACVQDEEGIVFIYDLEKQALSKELKFDEDGDYEGITRVGNTLYILRSDGKLFEVDDYTSKDLEVKKYDLDIPVKDNEGLAHDAQNNRLLIAGKSKPKGDDFEDKKVVFAFDLATKTLLKDPVYIFSEEQIEQFVIANYSDTYEKDKTSDLKIHPSGLAVNPLTGKLFVLSSKDNLIYVFNSESQVEAVFHLNKKTFKQPEGITFLDNGDMLISNEGGKEEPTLLFIPFQQ
jgi:uncharacterized protein YjiK